MELLSSQSIKQAPAVAHPLAFERKHVRSYLEGTSTPLLLVHAPAGYGKTTALAFFAQQEGASARWVTLDEGDRALSPFVHTIVSAIYGWRISELPTPPDVREAAKWIVGAVEELAVTAIVLDDFELVAASEEVNAVIHAIVERMPSHVRLVVGSEVSPPFVKRERLRQSIVELDQSDLVFDAEDVSAFFRDMHHYHVSDKFATSIARRSGGCAAVVNLIGQLVHDLPRYLRVDFEALPLGTSDHHLTLLLREVLSRAGYPPARAARDLANAAIGMADGTTPADTLLDMLASRGCLAHAFDTEPKQVLPHKLLRRLAPML